MTTISPLTANTITNLQQPSVQILKQNLFPNSLWVLFGIMSSSSGFLVSLTVLRNRKLRTNHYFQVLHLGLADLYYGCYSIVEGCKRVVETVQQIGEVSSPLWCAWETGFLYVGSLASTSQTVAMALDRAAAVAFPIFYVTTMNNRSWSQASNIFFWGVSLVVPFGVMLSGLKSADFVLTCQPTNIYQDWVMSFSDGLQMAFIVLTMILYALVVLFYYWHHKKQQNLVGAAAKANQLTAIAKQRKLTIICGFIVFVLVFTWATARIYSTVVLSYYQDISMRRILLPYSALLPHLCSPANLFLYFRFDEDFRKSLRELLRFCCVWKKVSVNEPVAIQVMPGSGSTP